MNRKVLVSDCQTHDKMVFEGSDCPLVRIAPVYVGWYQLTIYFFLIHFFA